MKDKWRKALHEEEMAQLNNAAGAARTELIGPQTQGSIEDSDEEKRQHFVLNTVGMEASVDGSAGSTRGGMPAQIHNNNFATSNKAQWQ